MLVRMWDNWNFCILLVGMPNGTAAVENSTEVPQRIHNRTPYDPAVPPLGLLKNQNQDFKEILALLHSLENYSQQPRCGNNLTLLTDR